MTITSYFLLYSKLNTPISSWQLAGSLAKDANNHKGNDDPLHDREEPDAADCWHPFAVGPILRQTNIPIFTNDRVSYRDCEERNDGQYFFFRDPSPSPYKRRKPKRPKQNH